MVAVLLRQLVIASICASWPLGRLASTNAHKAARRAVGGVVLCCSGWPGPDGCADFPVLAEGVGNAAEPPAVFIAGRRGHGGAGGAGGADHGVWVAGDQQGTAGAAADRRRAEPAAPRVGVRHPEVRVADGQLRDDVLAFPGLVNDRRAEGGLVEGDRPGGPVDPQFGLDAGHRDPGPSEVSCQIPSTLPAGSANSATRSVPSGYGGLTTCPPWAVTASRVASTSATKM